MDNASLRSPRFRLLLILGLALFLRCLFLGRESLWLDEAASWWFSSDFARAWHAEPTNPPLYYVLLHFWTRLFGSSEAGLRSLSVVPAMVSVGLVFSMARRLFSLEIACAASFYQAISTFQIYYAQEARCYSFVVCLVLLSSLVLWHAVNSAEGPRFRDYAAYALVAAVALYTHFIAIFFLCAHGAFVLFRRRRRLLPYLAASLATGILFSPWLWMMVKAAGAGGQQGRRYLLLKLPQTYFSFLFGDTLVPLDEQAVTHMVATLRSNGMVLLAAFSAVLVLAAFAWLAWKRWGDGMLFAVFMSTIPVLLAWAVSFKLMLFDERYLIAAAPFAYLIIAAAVVEIFLRRTESAGSLTLAGWTAVAAYSALLLLSMYRYYFDPRMGKEQWRGAVAYVETVASPGDLLVFDPDFLQKPYAYYQRRELPYLAATPAVDREIAASPDAIRGLAGGHARLWLITAHYPPELLAGPVHAAFAAESHRSFPNGHGIEIESFRLPR